MTKHELDLIQIKKSVIEDFKKLDLTKKDRKLLLNLIELHDWLAKDENDRFLEKLENLISKNEKENSDNQELKARLYSLKTQLNHNKYIEIRHLPNFSIYIEKEKTNIYPKKLPASWDVLFLEIKKIQFKNMRVSVYKSITKREKILDTKLNHILWEKELIKILEDNVFTNTQIILYHEKEKL